MRKETNRVLNTAPHTKLTSAHNEDVEIYHWTPLMNQHGHCYHETNYHGCCLPYSCFSESLAQTAGSLRDRRTDRQPGNLWVLSPEQFQPDWPHRTAWWATNWGWNTGRKYLIHGRLHYTIIATTTYVHVSWQLTVHICTWSTKHSQGSNISWLLL